MTHKKIKFTPNVKPTKKKKTEQKQEQRLEINDSHNSIKHQLAK